MKDFSVNSTVRTDLASEIREHWRTANGYEIPGTSYESTLINNIKVENLDVLNKQASEICNKPVGRYTTIEMGRIENLDVGSFDTVMQTCAKVISSFLPEKTDAEPLCLFVGLGNRNIVADAVGPMCADNFVVTNHIYQNNPDLFYSLNLTRTCSICPGVLGKTGIESKDIVKSAVDKIKPSFVIVVDALASSHLERLATTLQICSTGINPGSGVGNSRKELSENTLGVPVIAIGLPTVVDASTLCMDILKNAEGSDDAHFADKAEKYISPSYRNFFVTPKETDHIIKDCSKLIGYAINLALHKDMTKDEVDELLS